MKTDQEHPTEQLLPAATDDRTRPLWQRFEFWKWVVLLVGIPLLGLYGVETALLFWEGLQSTVGTYIRTATLMLYQMEGVKRIVVGACFVAMPFFVIWTIIRYSGSEFTSNGL